MAHAARRAALPRGHATAFPPGTSRARSGARLPAARHLALALLVAAGVLGFVVLALALLLTAPAAAWAGDGPWGIAVVEGR